MATLAAGGGERLGDHPPQPAGAAGDQDNFVLPESHWRSDFDRVRLAHLAAHQGLGVSPRR